MASVKSHAAFLSATLDARVRASFEALIAGVVSAPDSHGEWLKLVRPQKAVRKASVRNALLAAEKELRAVQPEVVPPAERLAALRALMAQHGVTGLVVPHADQYQCEYTPACAGRLAWLTGFTGSAGTAVVLMDKAAVFSDGRYTLQMAAQTDPALYETHTALPEPWLKENLKAGDKLGYDPWLFTPAQRDKMQAAASHAGAELVACSCNLVDAIWHDQPAAPISPIVAHPVEYAGKSSSEKLSELVKSLNNSKVGAVVLTAPDSIAWLLNIRGADVQCSPLPLSFAIVKASGKVVLFTDSRKLTRGLKKHLGKNARVCEPDMIGKALDCLGKQKTRVQVDTATAACFIFDRLASAGAQIVRAADPCKLPKARKNAVELAGARACHICDGAALTRFIAFAKTNCHKGTFTEIELQEKLDGMRAELTLYRDLSFPTIMGFGPNAAIVHYRATQSTNAVVEAGNLLLVDSGGQYLDGTTDVTRTLAIGEPTAEMRDRFTRVLKGHIALATARFPVGTSGHQLDVLARLSLWKSGLDYRHGTGHGVGSYLGVHEGPQNISTGPNAQALMPGMVVSNEPGYYKAGEYGIRIENLVVVSELPAIEGGEEQMLGFETITMAPIDLDLVDVSLLDRDEIAWLNAYHAEVREKLTPHLDAQTAAWLAEATRPLKAVCQMRAAHHN